MADAAAPLITMVTLPTNNLTSGIVAAARLAASAGTSADAKLKELAFTVDKSLGIVLASTGDSSIRRVGDAANFQGTAILSACDDQSARCVVVITLTNEQVIAAGTTQVFDFRLMVSGSVIAGSYLTTSMDRPSVLTSGWTLIK